MQKEIYIKSPCINNYTFVNSKKRIEKINCKKIISRKNYYIYLISDECDLSFLKDIKDVLVIKVYYNPNYTLNYINEIYNEFDSNRIPIKLKVNRIYYENNNHIHIKFKIILDIDYISLFVLKNYLENKIRSIRRVFKFYSYSIDIDWYSNNFEIMIIINNTENVSKLILKLNEYLQNVTIHEDIIKYSFNLLTCYIFDNRFCELVNDIEVSKYEGKKRYNNL